MKANKNLPKMILKSTKTQMYNLVKDKIGHPMPLMKNTKFSKPDKYNNHHSLVFNLLNGNQVIALLLILNGRAHISINYENASSTVSVKRRSVYTRKYK